jgi:hypothetical protein
MPFKTADHKSIQFNGDTLDEVSDELAILAEETIEYVYGSVIRKMDDKGNVTKRYDVKVIVKLEEK